MKDRWQICCLYSEVSEASMSEGHVFSALNSLGSHQWTDKERNNQTDSMT